MQTPSRISCVRAFNGDINVCDDDDATSRSDLAAEADTYLLLDWDASTDAAHNDTITAAEASSAHAGVPKATAATLSDMLDEFDPLFRRDQDVFGGKLNIMFLCIQS